MIAIMSAPIDAVFRQLPATARKFAKGAFLFHQTEPIVVIHRVTKGAAQLRRQQAAGSVLVLQRATGGDVLAEASLFATHYHCDAMALVPTETLAVGVAALRRQLAVEPALAEAWAAHLALEVQAARLRAEILALRTVADRLDAWLAWHDGKLPPRGEWKLVADEIAVSPEALYRELTRRRRDG
mgnify:CR=1 FL=1